MTHNFGSLVFTPVVKALQERYGSRRQYARLETFPSTRDRIGAEESDFIGARDTFYMATIGSTGWPYIQHRGGPKGFLKVIDQQTIAFADFRGNKQYISAGNLTTNDRVALILMDYPNQLRLKILGHVEVVEGEQAKEWIPKVSLAGYHAVIERVFVIRVEAMDWNCQQHIIRRFTVEEIHEELLPIEKRMQELERANESLRAEIAQLGKDIHSQSSDLV